MYGWAAAVPALAVAGSFQSLRCIEKLGCKDWELSTQSWLLLVTLGAVVGVVGMAVVDIVTNARYALVNRAEAKRRRRARRNSPLSTESSWVNE